MSQTRPIPEELLPYVVRQDYQRYDAADQATWRFVMLHLSEHLAHAAHPSYTRGLERSALSTRKIPRIEEMDRALAELGWGAVCVDGFIPPRVFQRFQALSMLPIAADIRTPQHIAYTPAPDIIHEAAGHAPILADSTYAAYLQRSGQTGELAFSSPEDHEVYQAIAFLSRVKELLPAGSPQVTAAEARLTRAWDQATEVTEAARMARLYWWTAEYGLIGTPERYSLYGAGLLSSLGEAVYCLDEQVAKLPLDSSCLEQGYDITRPQPQLYVTPSFEALFDVLDQAVKTLAVNQGLSAALRAALNSRLPAWLCLSNGDRVKGTVSDWDSASQEPAFVEFARPEPCLALFGPPQGSWSPAFLSQLPGLSQLELRYANGMTISANPATCEVSAARRWLRLRNAHVKRGSTEQHFPSVEIWFDGRLERVLPADDHTAQGPSRAQTAPAVRQLGDDEKELRGLYERAQAAWQRQPFESCVPAFEQVHDVLRKSFPDEWLLRWNLLENLLQIGELANAQRLADELQLLELKFQKREPIATGLRSLLRRVQAAQPDAQEGKELP